MDAKKILVINQYYAPDVASSGQLLAELCEGLAQHGHAVRVICGQPSYQEDSEDAPVEEITSDVKVRRVNLGGLKGRTRLSNRIWGYIRFLWLALITSRRAVKEERPDLIITLSNPPLVGMIGVFLSVRYKIPFLYVLYDIHPDIVIHTNWIRLPKMVFWIWNEVSKWILREASRVVVIGQGMKRTIVEDKEISEKKITVIPVWARPEISVETDHGENARMKYGIGEDDLVLLSAGNLGIMHPVEPILNSAKAMESNALVKFFFVGGGEGLASVREFVELNNLEHIYFLPYQSEKDFVEILLMADICFVMLEDGMEKYAVPSRAYTFMSAGRPLIAIMDENADIARMIHDMDCGWHVSDERDLVSVIECCIEDPQLPVHKGCNSRDGYLNGLSKSQVISEYDSLIRSMTA